MKRFLVVVFAVILSGALGVLIPFLLEGSYAQVFVDQEALRLSFQQELETILLNKETSQNLNPYNISGELLVMQTATAGTKPASSSTSSDVATPDPDPNDLDENQDNQTYDTLESINNHTIPAGAIIVQTDRYVGDAYLDGIIKENRDAIDDADLNKGIALYHQLDIAYLYSLFDGEVTEAKKAEVYGYLNDNLSGAQLEEVKGLYNRYIGLMN